MARGEEKERRACLLLIFLLLVDSVHLKPLEPRTVPAKSVGSNTVTPNLRKAVTQQSVNPHSRAFPDLQTLIAGNPQTNGLVQIPGDLHEESDNFTPFSLEAIHERDGVDISETVDQGLARLEHLMATTTLSLDVDHAAALTKAASLRVKRQDQNVSSPISDNDDKLSQKVNEIMQHRESRTTEVLESTVLQVLELLGSYEGKGLNMSQTKRLVSDTCGQDVWQAVQVVMDALGEGEDLIHHLASIALLQLHRCQQPALQIASTIAETFAQTSPVSTQVPREASFATQAENVFQAQRLDCDAEAECRQRGISEVRDIFRPIPSLLATYDVIATAVFATSDVPSVAHHLLGDTLSDVHVSLAANTSAVHLLPDAIPLDTTSGSHQSSPLTKRSSCEDKKEAKAQAVISWIPILGTFYNLVSSAVYAGKGCKDVAKERAIEGTIDVAMDLGTAVTFGAGAAAFQGIKTVAKVGVKAGVKAVVKSATKAAGKSFKKVAGRMLKDTVKAYKNPIKGAIKETVETVKAPIELGKSAHAFFKNIKKAPLDKTKSAIDVPGTGGQGSWRCKRTPPLMGCKRTGTSVTKTKLSDKAQKKFGSYKGAQNAQQLGDDMWDKYLPKFDRSLLPTTVENNVQRVWKKTGGIDLMQATENLKDQFKGLQHIVLKKTDRVMYVRQKIGDTTVEYITIKQFKTGGEPLDQVVIKFKGKNGKFSDTPPYFDKVDKTGAVTEKGILTELDDFAKMSSAERKKIVEAMLSAFDGGQSSLAAVFAKNQEAGKAAQRFIVLTQLAEAVPGRHPGMDKYFRGWLRQMQSDSSKTFTQFGQEAGLVLGKGDLAKSRKLMDDKALRNTDVEPSSVDKVVEQMSDDRR